MCCYVIVSEGIAPLGYIKASRHAESDIFIHCLVLCARMQVHVAASSSQQCTLEVETTTHFS